jgi:hypothetical protein
MLRASQAGSDIPSATQAVAFFSPTRVYDSASKAGGVARMLSVRNAASLRQSGRGFSPVTSAGGTSPRRERRRLLPKPGTFTWDTLLLAQNPGTFTWDTLLFAAR